MEIIDLKNRVLDKQGNIVYFPDALIELLYKDVDINDVYFITL